MSKPFNGLTPAQAELLALLAEEAAEVIQVVGKILRHGYDSPHPVSRAINRDLLAVEIGHVNAAVGMIVASGDLSEAAVAESIEEKVESVQKYLHHNPPIGG